MFDCVYVFTGRSVCVYVCMCFVCVNVCVCESVGVRVVRDVSFFECVDVCVCLCTHVYVCLCLCVNVCMHVCVCVYVLL